ncbi:alpha/beta hydrolase [Flavobacterium sp. LM5]|uniref:alpha/beta fold hydrolase n=1 Tax=Flavobacterium sp. LM5 TaxID=1938610 RepID=UPI00099472F0|nr:alpha/beta fold hydrolase [Flavobacterium sp. LM5]OOV27832.1 alpha/beta hydrolase [Flavobacterium sp. LM5]
MKKTALYLYIKCLGLGLNLLSFAFPKKATKIAYGLFSEPRAGKLNNEQLPEILQQAQSEKISYKDSFFQTYTWKGNDTIILLVHGWESNASRWEKLLPFLKKSGSTIVAIDAPAHGLSSGKEFSIPQYAAFIHLAVQKFNPDYLIGHSIGGQTCLYYQSMYQNKAIKKMVILGAPSDFTIILSNFIKLLRLNTTIANNIENHYLNHFKLDINQFSSQLFAKKVDTKGFIAHDTLDPVVKIAEAKKIAATWKDAIFYETNGLGHSMHDNQLYHKVSVFLFGKEN